MDPLSITASIIALIGATHKVAAGLKKLASLRGAPAAVLALNNELSDLRLVLSEAEPLLLKHGRVAPGTQAVETTPAVDDNLRLSIDRARDRLAELESVLQNRLMARMGTIDKLGWLKEQDKVRKALQDLRTVRLNITAMLGVVTSSASFRIETKLQDVQIANQRDQVTVSQALSSQKDMIEKAFAYITAAQKQNEERLERLEASVAATDRHSGMMPSGDSGPPAQEVSHRECNDYQRSLPRVETFSTLRMRFLRQQKCVVWCDCVCHTPARARTPDMLQSIFGALFVGYVGLPALTAPCSTPKCRRGSEGFLQVNYYFPQWFVARIISMVMRFQDSKIPKISMRVLNVRNTYENIFVNANGNNADLVAHQLRVGKASVLDVTYDSGHSPLHIAVCASSVETIEVLLRMGAEPFLENKTQETPYDMAWNTIFSFQGTPNASARRVEEIRALFPTVNVVEERRRFTRIHKIILQILHLDLEKELSKNRSMVTDVDVDGKTALSWAAARGDSKSVEALLRHGASPNTPDRIGQGPLRQAMKAYDPGCAKLLLAYGAKVDQRDNWQQTALISAMYYPDPVSFVTPLLNAGAQVNVFDSRGHSPLMEALSENQPDAVKILLDIERQFI